jgi:recombination protein RecT
MSSQKAPIGQQTALVVSKQNLRTLLEKAQVNQTLERVSTRWLSADQLKTQAIIAVARNPALLQCSQASFLEAMVRAAELGLRFAGAGGEAYLVPYKNKCTLIVGYRGLCALARRTGKVTRIEARAVHERDHFKISFGSGQQLMHRTFLGSDRGEIDAIRKRSPAGDSGPWQTDYEEMARKTVLRRLCKFLPFPTAFEDALADEETKSEQPRKSVDVNVPTENNDYETGEITNDEPIGEATSSQSTDTTKDLGTQKTQLISDICNALNKLHSKDSIEDQAARLRTLNHVFGKVQIDEIAKLPVQILQALDALKNQTANVENELPV